MATGFDFAHVERLLPDLPRKQQMLARALLDEPEVFAFGTLRALEKAFSISGVTAIRFAKSLGYEGYSDLQEAVRAAYFDRIGFVMRTDESEATQAMQDPVALAMQQQREALDATFAHLDAATLSVVADDLVRARRIVVFGVGAAGLVGQLLVRLLRYVGLHAEWVAGASVDAALATHDLDERDVAVVVSLWLDFTDTSQFLAACKERGARTVALAGSHISSLMHLADHALVAQARGTTQTFSVVAPVALVEILVAEIATRFPERVVEIRQALHDHYVEARLIDPKPRAVVSKE